MNYWTNDDTKAGLSMMRSSALTWRTNGNPVDLVCAMAHRASIRQRTVIPKLGDAYALRCIARACKGKTRK